MGVGVLVPVDPMVFLVIAFVVIVGAVCCATLGEGSSEKSKNNYSSRSNVNSSKSSVEWKICYNCGKKVNKVAKKCPYCGYPL